MHGFSGDAPPHTSSLPCERVSRGRSLVVLDEGVFHLASVVIGPLLHRDDWLFI